MKAPDSAFRAHNPKWAWAPTSGKGAAIWGGRFNRKGVETLYLSLDPNTAMKEASQAFPLKIQPLMMVQYELDLDGIEDLTDPATRKKWGTSTIMLRSPWESLADGVGDPPTWLLADQMINADVAGILVQSFAPGAIEGDLNLVLWKWGPEPPYKCVEIDDEGRLGLLRPKVES